MFQLPPQTDLISALLWERLWQSTTTTPGYVNLSLFKTGCNVSDTSHVTVSSSVSQPDLLGFPQSRMYNSIHGGLINDGGRSKTGRVEDSIYIYYTYGDFTNDSIYILLSGVRKSGYNDDVVDH